MKDLGQWLVTRLQTTKQADAVTSGALGLVPDAATDMLHAAQHLNFNPRTNPLLAGLRPHYSFGQGVKDIGNGAARAGWETVRAIMPGMGHNGANSIGDNFIQAGSRMVAAPFRAWGSNAGGDAIEGNKALAGAFDGFKSNWISEPWARANRNPDGLIQAKREMSGLYNRWQPQALYGSTLKSHPANVAENLNLFGGAEARPSFWSNWLGTQHYGKPIRNLRDIPDIEKNLPAGYAWPPHP